MSSAIESPEDAPKSLPRLMVGAIGVVFGDIGTSPLYALKECFAGPHPLALDTHHVMGVLSLIFWSVMLVVSIKYVTFIMRADNKGEGGSLALLALVTHITQGTRLAGVVAVLGIFAAALFYGDSMITPAISVLSAVEGLEIATPALKDYVVPVTLVVLAALFLIQSKGTALIGALFGPVMCLWFGVLAILGILHIAGRPEVLMALDPRHAIGFFMQDQWRAFLALGSVVLALTGAEALYADMGHFGRRPIRIGWFALILPALLLNYFGQGALLIEQPDAIENPFYRLTPEWGLLPMVGLATLATVIASQAVISGAFSVTRQAIQLGYLPRMTIVHTSHKEIGQIYIPFINWMLLSFVAALVVGFGSSSNLAAAYGVAVTGTMLIDTLLIAAVMFLLWKWNPWLAGALVAVFLAVDLAFFLANATKILHGGWFPLVIGLLVFLLLTTWKRGRMLLFERFRKDAMPVELFLKSISARIHRVPGTAVFMTGTSDGIPHALLHNLKHNKVLHERNLLLTVLIEETPFVPSFRRLEVKKLDHEFYRVTIRYGFMEEPDVPGALLMGEHHGIAIDLMDISFFLGRETIIPSMHPGMALWREFLFAWMSRNASSAMDFFRLPTNRVVELGSQVEI
jgi:KUP system potassium uptake protein